jgi:signal transduction histidine kinase
VRASSIRLRLLAAGGAAVVVSLAVAAVGLQVLFERHIQRLAHVELAADLDQIATGLARAADGRLAVAEPPNDPRYAQPLSGLYWQVEGADGAILGSRSLWDMTIALPDDPGARDGRLHERRIPGPRGETLLVLERVLTAPQRFGAGGVRAMVALDAAQLRSATRAFVRDLFPYLGLLAAALIAAGAVQIAVGLRPLAAVGARVAAIRSGAAHRLGSAFPDEVQPMAAEVDALIEARETETARARARAADLAHGLKTPLQALIGEAERLRARGDTAAAAGIEEIVAAMTRHVDRELARARIASAGRAVAADPSLVVRRVLAVIRRTADGGRLDWRLDAPVGLAVRIDADDLTEAVGALLENAARHARTAVTLRVAPASDGVAISIRDDGPGIPPTRLAELTARGARLDLSTPGSGLGLSIAEEIAEAAGGSLRLVSPEAGGLEAALTLPAARTLTAR